MPKPPPPPGLIRHRHPTMADVAERAGVSKMTVSRTIKGGGQVSESARKRIQAAIDELGYVLDQTAGAFSSKRSGFVAVIQPSINNSNFADTARGITAAIADSGRQLLLGFTDYRVENEEKLVEAMQRRRPEGIILTGGSHTDRTRRLLAAAAVPVIETWDLPAKPIDHVVGFSNVDAASAMVHRLYERGYRNIAFIGGTSNRDDRGAERRLGYTSAIEELGLPRGRVVSFGEPPISMEQGAEAIVHLVQQWPDVDAAVCVSDLSAFGAVMECHRRGWAVPKRIAVAGFGDFDVSRCCHPRITTVAVDGQEIGRAAGALLLRSIDAAQKGLRLAAETVLIPFQVLEREST